jgi:hypothetical protein
MSNKPGDVAEEQDVITQPALPAPNDKVTKFLTREAILAASDIVTEAVDIPEWGGQVMVRALTGEERDSWEESLLVEKKGRNGRTTREANLKNIRAKLVSISTYDADGNRLFTEYDVQVLGKKSASALQRIFKVAQRLSGLTDEEVDDLANDLGNDQSGNSGSH